MNYITYIWIYPGSVPWILREKQHCHVSLSSLTLIVRNCNRLLVKLLILNQWPPSTNEYKKLADDEGDDEDEEGEDCQDDEDRVVHLQVVVVHPLLYYCY